MVNIDHKYIYDCEYIFNGFQVGVSHETQCLSVDTGSHRFVLNKSLIIITLVFGFRIAFSYGVEGNTMRRLVAIPVKTAMVATLLVAGAVYVAAEARQAVARRQQQQLSALEQRVLGTQTSAVSPAAGGSQTPRETNQISKTPTQKTELRESDELAAELQAAQLPAQKPARKQAADGHTRQIVVSIADRKLALLQDGQLVKTYPIAVGARVSPSPDGDFVVINRAKDPTYNHKGKTIEPGKDNPLGSRWMGLSAKGYGIHGTNVPSSIGKAASHGCFRMGKKDVEDLYSRVQVGDTVTVRRERDATIAKVFAPESVPAPKPATASAEVQVASAASPTTGVVTTEAEQR